MDAETRKAVEERAHALWEEAGRPEGSALLSGCVLSRSSG